MSFSDKAKIVTWHTFMKDGHSKATAARATLASMPLSKIRPSRAFAKDARKLSKQFARQAKTTDDLDALATETLEALSRLAIGHGESYYAELYEKALRAGDEDV